MLNLVKSWHEMREAAARANRAERDLREGIGEHAGSREPQIVLDYEYNAKSIRRSGRPFTVRNVGPMAAFDVQIHEIQNDTGYKASFASVSKLLSGEPAKDVYANVEWPQGIPPLFRRRFEMVLERFDWTNLPIGRKVSVPVFVSYKDFQGNKYKDEWVIEYSFASGRAATRLRKARVDKNNED